MVDLRCCGSQPNSVSNPPVFSSGKAPFNPLSLVTRAPTEPRPEPDQVTKNLNPLNLHEYVSARLPLLPDAAGSVIAPFNRVIVLRSSPASTAATRRNWGRSCGPVTRAGYTVFMITLHLDLSRAPYVSYGLNT